MTGLEMKIALFILIKTSVGERKGQFKRFSDAQKNNIIAFMAQPYSTYFTTVTYSIQNRLNFP